MNRVSFYLKKKERKNPYTCSELFFVSVILSSYVNANGPPRSAVVVLLVTAVLVVEVEELFNLEGGGEHSPNSAIKLKYSSSIFDEFTCASAPTE